MIIFVLLLFVLTLWKSRLCLGSGYNNADLFHGALERNSTDSIKGIFILYVFLRHVQQYIPFEAVSGTLDRLFLSADGLVRQLLVVMFLFYSGYGVMEAIKRKGAIYVNSIPKKRFLTTLLNFDVAVAFFIIVDLMLGLPLTWDQSLLAFTGWTSVGNSNWYIFCILFLYFAIYLAFKLINTPPPIALLCLIILTILYIGVVQRYRGSWWVNTALAYPAGVVFSMYKGKFERFFVSRYWLSLIGCTALFLIFYILPIRAFYLTANLCAVFFAFLVVLVTMKWRIWNPALHWCGVRLFPLYIYQRIPMIIFATIYGGTLPAAQPYIFVTLSLAVALAITYLHKYIDIKLA